MCLAVQMIDLADEYIKENLWEWPYGRRDESSLTSYTGKYLV